MSSKEKQQASTVVQQDLALKVYIDSLLLEPVEEEAEAPPVVEQKAPDVEPRIQVEVQAPVETATPPPQIKPELGDPFEALMFKVAGGLSLSVPLIDLNGILQWDGECTHVPGHAEWFLGIVSNRGRQVKVIDIAKFVIPENHQAREHLKGERNFSHLLLVDNGRYGLACDALGEVLKLNQEQVRWRIDRTRRPWLAGTLINQMCALIDVDAFVDKLKEGIRLTDIR